MGPMTTIVVLVLIGIDLGFAALVSLGFFVIHFILSYYIAGKVGILR